MESALVIGYRLTVHEAKDLQAKDLNGFSDPYVKIRYGNQKFKTDVKKKTLNPRWSEEFEMITDATESLPDTVEIEVWDYDKLGSNEFMGSVTIVIDEWPAKELKTSKWFSLNPKKRSSTKINPKPLGEICLSLKPIKENDGAENGHIKKARKMSDSKPKSKRRASSSSSSRGTSKNPGANVPRILVVECEMTSPVNDPAFALYPHQQDRLQHLRRSANIQKMKTTDTFGASVGMDVFVSQVNQIKTRLVVVKASNRDLRSLYQQYFAAVREEERDGFGRQVEELIHQSNKSLAFIGSTMKELDSMQKKALAVAADTNDSRVRANVTAVLGRTFVETMVEFQEIQQQFKLMHSNRVRQLYQIANPNASPALLDEISMSDLSVSEAFEQKFSATRNQKATEALAYVKSKHNEILSIETGLREIQELFNQCAALVAVQSEFLNQIAANIDRTYEHLRQANQDLHKARYFQKHRFALSAPQYDRLYKS